jgi:hypothetical protein
MHCGVGAIDGHTIVTFAVVPTHKKVAFVEPQIAERNTETAVVCTLRIDALESTPLDAPPFAESDEPTDARSTGVAEDTRWSAENVISVAFRIVMPRELRAPPVAVH